MCSDPQSPEPYIPPSLFSLLGGSDLSCGLLPDNYESEEHQCEGHQSEGHAHERGAHMHGAKRVGSHEPRGWTRGPPTCHIHAMEMVCLAQCKRVQKPYK